MAKDKQAPAGIRFASETSEDRLTVDAYGDGGFRLNGIRVAGGVIVTVDGFYPLEPASCAALTPNALVRLTADDTAIELILFGTGEQLVPLPKDVRLWCRENGFGFDLMNTGAAARTYNVLQLEGRRVAAVLLPV